jgi:hypothetical protein
MWNNVRYPDSDVIDPLRILQVSRSLNTAIPVDTPVDYIRSSNHGDMSPVGAVLTAGYLNMPARKLDHACGWLRGTLVASERDLNGIIAMCDLCSSHFLPPSPMP